MRKRPWLRVLPRAAALAGIVACLAQVLSLANDIASRPPAPPPRRPSSTAIVPAAPQAGPRITRPVAGAEVDRTVDVEATTPFRFLNHYVLVTEPSGARRVQDGPVPVTPGGVITARVPLGSAAVGTGEDYTVTVFATAAVLGPGADLPGDAVLANAVRVRRRPESSK